MEEADVEIVCFDCDVLTPTVVLDDDAEALRIAQDHADECGHHLIIQRWVKARSVQLWSVIPTCETDH
jgi:hypothetical protein